MVILDKTSGNEPSLNTKPTLAGTPSRISRLNPQVSNVTLAEQYEAYEEIENDAEQEAENMAITGDMPKKYVKTRVSKKEDAKSKSCGKCFKPSHKCCSVKSKLSHCWKRIRKNLILVSNHNFIHHGRMRSRDSVQKERARQITTSGLILHPYSLLRYIWDILIICSCLFFLSYQPVWLWVLEETISWTALIPWIFSVAFTFDVLLNFRTGIIDSDSNDIRLDQSRICTEYFQTWFPIDFLSSIPWEHVTSSLYQLYTFPTSPDTSLLTTMKQLGILRYLLIFRLFRYLRNVLLGFGCNGLEIRLIHTTLLLIITIHWFACAHSGIDDISLVFGEDSLGVSWIAKGGLAHHFRPRHTIYPYALLRSFGLHYFSNISPTLWTEVIMLLANALTLFILLTVLVAYLFALLQSWDVTERRFIKISTEMAEYMKFYHTPIGLRQRALDYLTIRYKGHHFRKSILDSLSPSLQKDLLLNNCLSLVEEVPFFANLQRHVVQDIVLHLEFDVYMENDVLIWAGTVGDSMYFIEHGSVSILAPDGRPVTILKDGNFFGEMSLVFSEPRAATVIANSKSDIYRLSKDNFIKVIAPYPKLYDSILKVAESRAKFLDKAKLYKRKKEAEEEEEGETRQKSKRKIRKRST